MDDDLPQEFKYATSEELLKALGESDEAAKAGQTRIEFLAGNYPHLVKTETH